MKRKSLFPVFCLTQLAAVMFNAFPAYAEVKLEASASLLPTATLVTNLGDHLPGHWLLSDEFDGFSWWVEGFSKPFEIEKQFLSAIHVRHQSESPSIEGSYRCELTSGDFLYGTPLAISDETLVIELAESGPLRIDRKWLKKLSPRQGSGQSVHTTPLSLNEWEGDKKSWKETSTGIKAIEDGAFLETTLDLGESSQTNLHFAWDTDPDFQIQLGNSGKEGQGLRLATWQKNLVLVAESESSANVILITDSITKEGDYSLNIYYDRTKGKILVTSDGGKKLGEFSWKEPLGVTFSLLSQNKGIVFSSAVVTPWNGSSPNPNINSQSNVRYKTGNLLSASVTSWNPETKEWTLAVDASSAELELTEEIVSHDEIESLLFASEKPISDKSLEGVFSARFLTRTGMKFTGEIVKLLDNALEIRCQGIEDPFQIPLENLLDVVFLKTVSNASESRRFPRIQIGQASCVGQLIDEPSKGVSKPLVWKPNVSRTAATITLEASGSITYRESQPPIKKTPPKQVKANNGFFGGIVKMFSSAKGILKTKNASSKMSAGPILYLRSGDCIPCEPKFIDEEGVTFFSELTEATFASHAAIKALSLVGKFDPAKMTEEQRARLLTLPRAQQEYPPTHLLLSVDGDLLRTRVTTMDDKQLSLEVRLDSIKLPRKKVAAIVWLHQDELQEMEIDKPISSSSDLSSQAHAIRFDDVRLTFTPERVAGGVLFGRSMLLGNCRIETSQLDKLYFGKAIQEARKDPSHQLLALRPAIVPDFVTADKSTTAVLGKGSALVGQTAPPIQLKDLEGKDFVLQEHRGKVVVLDFWATWCGPCIQWMPELEKIISDYPREEVVLVAVNLLEEKEAIKASLERMQIEPTVLLDRDGVVADRYQATAIPQTVIIDQQGNVERLFIGGSSQIKQPLSEAIKELTKQSVPN